MDLNKVSNEFDGYDKNVELELSANTGITYVKNPVSIGFKYVNCAEMKATRDLYEHYYKLYCINRDSARKKRISESHRALIKFDRDKYHKIVITLADRLLKMEEDLLHEYEKEHNK